MAEETPPSSVKFLMDEDVKNGIIRGLLRHYPEIDLLRVQDTEVFQQSDEVVLGFAAENERVVVSHDVNTMINTAYQRVAGELPMAGLLIVHQSTAIGVAIANLGNVMRRGTAEFFNNQVHFIPQYLMEKPD